MTNSNSVIATMLSSIGLDIQDHAPILGGDFSWDSDPANDVSTGRIDSANFPGDFSVLDTAFDNIFTVFKVDGLIYSSTAFFKIDGTDVLTMEKGAELEVHGVETADGLTRIVLKDVNLADVTFNESGDDLKVVDSQNWNPFSDDIIRLGNYATYAGFNNIEFVFNGTSYRRGTTGDDNIFIDGASVRTAQQSNVSRWIDGSGGDHDHITYGGEYSSYQYDEKRGVVYGAGRDILTNVEDVSFTGCLVTFANDNYHLIKSKVA